MKIILPEHIGDIKLYQFQKYSKLLERKDLGINDFNERKIEIFTNIPFRQVKNVSQKDKLEILEQIDTALNMTVEFTPTFFLNDVEFGFIPNFDKITGAEYQDLFEYQNKVDKMHNLMAILFRPIKKKDVFKNYKIKSYKGTSEYADLMKEMPLSIVNGALVFFSNLAKELEIYILKSTMEVQVKV